MYNAKNGHANHSDINVPVINQKQLRVFKYVIKLVM